MSLDLQNLDLIDLISERHIFLRNITERLWNDSSDICISNSEWFVMARIYQKQPTISSVAKHVYISRQAAHKFVKSLESKGLVEIKKSVYNNKEKCLQLSELGTACYEKNMTLKKELEKKLAAVIGSDQLSNLKELLKSDWGALSD